MEQISTAYSKEMGREGRDLCIARSLLIALVPALIFSTTATALIEAALYISFVASPLLRRRLLCALKNPPSIALLAFLAVCAIGVLYGDAAWADRLGALKQWRKALVFFFAAAVFDDQRARYQALNLFVWFCSVSAAVSIFTFMWPLPGLEPGVIFKDHAIQGLFFATAAGIAFYLRASLWLPATLLLALTTAIGIGRVGYVALATIASILSVRHSWKVGVGTILACIVILVSSTTVRERIELGISELQTYENSDTLSSIGFRMIMLRHTASIIEEHWLFGVGTGGFDHAYKQRIAGASGWQATPTNDPHNQYLRTLSENGVPGILAFLAFIAATALSNSKDKTLLVAVLATWCVASLFASYFSRFTEGEFIFMMCGLLAAPPSSD
jgi:O-antigen ligase